MEPPGDDLPAASEEQAEEPGDKLPLIEKRVSARGLTFLSYQRIIVNEVHSRSPG